MWGAKWRQLPTGRSSFPGCVIVRDGEGKVALCQVLLCKATVERLVQCRFGGKIPCCSWARLTAYEWHSGGARDIEPEGAAWEAVLQQHT